MLVWRGSLTLPACFKTYIPSEYEPNGLCERCDESPLSTLAADEISYSCRPKAANTNLNARMVLAKRSTNEKGF